MRFRHLAAAATAVVLLTLTACGTQTAGSPGADTAPPPIGSEPEEPPSEEQADDGSGADAPPGSERSEWASYVNALDAIDPDIVHGEEDKAVDRARSQCQAVKEATHDQDELINLTNKRFTSPNHPEGHGLDTAEKILNVVERYVCPKTGEGN